jgi:hypothetical protein
MKSKINACHSCASARLMELDAEMNIHFPGLRNMDKPSIFVFPKIIVCLHCGLMQAQLSGEEVLRLQENTAHTENIPI